MIVAFGASWPINVYKSIRTKRTEGKSPVFLFLIALGYVSGIIGKILAANITWVFAFYVFNLTMVLTDCVLYFVNKKRAKRDINKDVPQEA